VNKNRRNERVNVSIPIQCTIATPQQEKIFTAEITDMSIEGVRLNIPLGFSKIKSKMLDFILDLPKPFKTIRGNGEIQWKKWNADKKCTTCGLKLSPMRLEQLQDIDTIISEIRSEKSNS
jgi:hypothetical protein